MVVRENIGVYNKKETIVLYPYIYKVFDYLTKIPLYISAILKSKWKDKWRFIKQNWQTKLNKILLC